MPRSELLMLFLRGDRDSKGGFRLFALSKRVGEDKAAVDSVAGNERECDMEEILGALEVSSSDESAGFSGCSEMEAFSSTAVVLISGDECVR